MKENRVDQRHRRRTKVYPDYEREQRYAEKMRRQQQEYSRQEWIEQERYAQQHRLGTRMQRNRIKQMEMRRKRRRGEILLCIGLVLILAVAFAAAKIYTKLDLWQQKAEKPDFVATAAEPSEVEDEILNIAVFGTDEDGFRTDVNIVASFHVKTKELHLISVPRDTRVTMTDEMISYLEKNGRYVPDKTGVYGQCKLTEVHAYAGEGNRCAFSVAMLEELLGIDIDYYVKVDLEAFREIVDAVGGVTFNVEERLYYSDPAQGLYIDLYPGEQVLNGEQAEMLVRFRSGYAQGDLKRIEVQQAFMKAFIEQVCSTKSILDNLDSLIRIGLEKTETNMPLSEALQYAKYVTQIDPATVTADTVPGEGGSYFDIDEEGTKELINYRIYDIEPAADATEDDSLTDTIESTESTNG